MRNFYRLQLPPGTLSENVETDWEEGSCWLKLRPWKRGAAGSRLVSLLLMGLGPTPLKWVSEQQQQVLEILQEHREAGSARVEKLKTQFNILLKQASAAKEKR